MFTDFLPEDDLVEAGRYASFTTVNAPTGRKATLRALVIASACVRPKEDAGFHSSHVYVSMPTGGSPLYLVTLRTVTSNGAGIEYIMEQHVGTGEFLEAATRFQNGIEEDSIDVRWP